MKFNEAQLEAAIIELLEAEGYPHVHGETIARHPHEVLIKADLRAFLAQQYAKDGITPAEIEAVIRQLEAYSAADLYESNKAIMRLVSDGFHLKRERIPHPQPLSQGEKGVKSSSPSGRSGDEGSKQANLQMTSILGDPDRLKALAADFVHHYEARIAEGATVADKAMFVSSSRTIAYDLYKEVIALRLDWAEVQVCAC